VAVGERDARVHERTGSELWAGLLGGTFEGEVRKGGVGGVRGQVDEVEVGGGAGDLADDEVGDRGDVL